MCVGVFACRVCVFHQCVYVLHYDPNETPYMRGDWKCAEEQEHDKLLNDDHSVCVSMTVCVRV